MHSVRRIGHFLIIYINTAVGIQEAGDGLDYALDNAEVGLTQEMIDAGIKLLSDTDFVAPEQ